MNNIRVLGGICCLCLLAGGAFAQDTQFAPLDAPAVIERGMHHRVWQTVSSSVDENGNVNYQTNSFTELCSGICYEEDGKWYDSVEEIELHPDGAFAQKAPHKVFFAPNLNEEGAVELISPEGLRLKGGPLGLAYYDKEKRQSVWIARIRDCWGELYSPNQVVYRDAMDGILCSVRYTYKLGSFEQDVILHEAPPTPEEYGFSSETTFLEVISDFQEIPEDFTIRRYVSEANAEAGEVEGEDWEDSQLEFGSMRMAAGKAFSLSEEESLRQLSEYDVPVSKSFQITDGRNILIEGVEYRSIYQYLEVLPLKAKDEEMLAQKPASDRTYFSLPKKHETQHPMMFASSGQALPQGVVIDYLAVTTTSNMTFQSGATYYVSGPVTLSGTTTLEGGCVIKYGNVNDPGITVTGPIVTRTGPGRPVILTAKDDNSVGEILPNSTGTPNGYYGFYPFVVDYSFYPGETLLNYMRFSYLSKALHYINQSGHILKNVQFVHCGQAIEQDSSQLMIQNGLLYDCECMFGGSDSTLEGVHLTLNKASFLNAGGATLYLTNSIITEVPDEGWNLAHSEQTVYNPSAAGIYSSAGGAAHYLGSNAYKDIGTLNIDEGLLSELQKKTTEAPKELTTFLTEETFLEPVVSRDIDGIDLGYHYDPIDYVATDLAVCNATLTLEGGVTLGVYGETGIRLKSGARLNSQGLPEALNRIIRLQAIQEQANANWTEERSPSLIRVDSTEGVAPSVQLKFTELSQLAGSGVLLSEGNQLSNLSLCDCQLYNARLCLNKTGSRDQTLRFTNNLFDHVCFCLGNSMDTSTVAVYNNTFYGGINEFLPSFGNKWIIRDNYFHGTTHTQNDYLSNHDYNGYHAVGTTRLTPYGPNDQVVRENTPFSAGALGSFYFVDEIALRDSGSRTANEAGLCYHTTQTANVAEGDTPVDIGFHYVAVNRLGLPLDNNENDIPDYLEDGSESLPKTVNQKKQSSQANTRSPDRIPLKVYTPLK